MRKYKTLLFDADMTLFDFDTAETEAFYVTMKKNRIYCGEKELIRYKEINASLWERLARCEIDQADIQRLRFAIFLKELDSKYTDADGIRVNEDYRNALAEESVLLDGAKELCAALSEKYEMYIVTNGITVIQRKRFDNSEIKQYFKGIFISEEIGIQKPKREYFDYVFSHIGEEKRDGALLIGDSLSSDIKGANICGIDCIWYNASEKAAPDDIKPTYIAGSYGDILNILLAV